MLQTVLAYLVLFPSFLLALVSAFGARDFGLTLIFGAIFGITYSLMDDAGDLDFHFELRWKNLRGKQ